MNNDFDSKFENCIAVIGMAGRFPGADNTDEFWANLKDGVSAFGTFGKTELQADSNGMYTIRAGAPLKDVAHFDADFFGYSPKEAEVINPQHRIFLECAWQALENGGYIQDSPDTRIGLYAGESMNMYLHNILQNTEIVENVGRYQVALANDKDYLSTMVSYKLNLKGPSVSVQTACSSSMVAICFACQSLLNYQCDIALAGGVSVMVPYKIGEAKKSEGILSKDGICRPFDAAAGGTVSGEGVGIIVLKRFEDAVHDRDTIRAVIRGWAMNNDGSRKIGYTAPSVQMQSEVIVEAMMQSGVRPESISYVEAHGTGTSLGDPIEIEALTQSFRTKTDRYAFCGIGSVKSNIGHLDAASGVAGVIKAVLMLENKEIPSSLYFTKPNEKIPFVHSPFYVNKYHKEWTTGSYPRRCGISSFGIGGTNTHIILEEAPAKAAVLDDKNDNLIVISAKTEEALRHISDKLLDYLQVHNDTDFNDCVFTLQVGRKHFNYRKTFACSDMEDALRRLRLYEGSDRKEAYPVDVGGKVLFHFTGLWTETAYETALELYKTEKQFRLYVDKCILEIEKSNAFPELKLSGSYPDNEAARAALTLVFEYSLSMVWMDWGVLPEAVYGVAMGELVMACVSGMLSIADAVRLIVNNAPSRDAVGCASVADVKVNTSELSVVNASGNPESGNGMRFELSYWNNLISSYMCGIKNIEQEFSAEKIILEIGFDSAAGSSISVDKNGMRHASFMPSRAQQTCRQRLFETLGLLWESGVEINWKKFNADKVYSRIALPGYPFKKDYYWAGMKTHAPEEMRYSNLHKSDDAGLFYVPAWKPSPINQAAPNSDPLRLIWLVFYTSHMLNEAIADHLRQATQEIVVVMSGNHFVCEDKYNFTIDPQNEHDYFRLLDELNKNQLIPDKILHLWNVAGYSNRDILSGYIEDSQYQGFFSLLYLAQAIEKSGVTKQIQIKVISSNMHGIRGEKELFPEKSTLLGACKIISKEYEKIQCQSIDIDVDKLDSKQMGNLSESLLNEYEAESGGSLIAYRYGQRLKQVYEALDLPAPRSYTLFRSGGVYLITGGLGGVGLNLVRHIAKKIKATFILLGRHQFPAREDWSRWINDPDQSREMKSKILEIQEIEQTGSQLDIVCADVTKQDQMQRIFQQLTRTYGQINGIIHAAGVPGDGIIQLKTSETAWSVMAPKVLGTLVLESVFSEEQLDFFILCSSLNAIVDYIGQADYTAANAFLDNYANYSLLKNKGYTLSINWDRWINVGMSAGTVNKNTDEKAEGLLPEEALKAFDNVLACQIAPQVAISKKDLNVLRIQNSISGISGLVDSIHKNRPGAYGRPALKNEYIAPVNELQQNITCIWKEILGIENIGIHDNFLDLGGHSLLAIQVISKIETDLKCHISLKDFFAQPTVAGLEQNITAHRKTTDQVMDILFDIKALSDVDANYQFGEGE